MHEWALADGVVTTAHRVAGQEKITHIAKLKIKVGEVQQIDMDIFRDALEQIIQLHNGLLKDATIEIDTAEAVLKCRICGHTWAFQQAMKRLNQEESEAIHFVPEMAHVYIGCPACSSPDFEVVTGRGVWLDAIIGE
jgi:hydrogenase nickel incorporation protein HypA/HybF